MDITRCSETIVVLQQRTPDIATDPDICSLFKSCEWTSGVTQDWSPSAPYTLMEVSTSMVTRPVDTVATPDCVSEPEYVHRALLFNEADIDANSSVLEDSFTTELDDYLIGADGHSTKYSGLIGTSIHIELEDDNKAYTVKVNAGGTM